MSGLPDDARAELDAVAARAAATVRCPALAWGVMVDGRLEHFGSVGALDEGRPLGPDSVFRIASMTKSFTAATVLALRDDGALRLDDPVAEMAPELSLIGGPTSDSPAITLRHLLSMSAGLAGDDAWADRHLDLSAGQLAALLSPGVIFACSPGEHFEYSNLGFALIGLVVRSLTGEPLRAHCERRILTPLGLARTTWDRPTGGDWARPHRLDGGVAGRDGEPLGDGELAPMGGLWSTVADLARWMSWLADAFPARDGDDGGPLRRSTRREMQSVHRLTDVLHTPAVGDGPDAIPLRVAGGGYGFGLNVVDDAHLGHMVAHSGGLPGYGSHMRWLPGRGTGAVALANVTYAPMEPLTRRMLEILGDHHLLPAAGPPPAPAVERAARSLIDLLNGWTADAATAVLADNVLLDEPRAADAARTFVAEHGALAIGTVVVESRAAATVHATAADGTAVTIPFSLSPVVPPAVQEYEVKQGAAGPNAR